jgi:hypothetical protein
LIFPAAGCLIPAEMPILLALSLILALVSQAGSCRQVSAGHASDEGTQAASAETWGGEHVSADVGADGVRFEFDCAHGQTDGPLAPGRDGRFDLRGYFIRERGVAASAGQENRSPARYSGRVRGVTMTLAITLTDTREEIGTFTLTRGHAGQLTKCM